MCFFLVVQATCICKHLCFSLSLEKQKQKIITLKFNSFLIIVNIFFSVYFAGMWQNRHRFIVYPVFIQAISTTEHAAKIPFESGLLSFFSSFSFGMQPKCDNNRKLIYSQRNVHIQFARHFTYVIFFIFVVAAVVVVVAHSYFLFTSNFL